MINGLGSNTFLSTRISLEDAGLYRPVARFALLFTIAYFAIFEFRAPTPEVLRGLVEFALVGVSLGAAIVLFLLAGALAARRRRKPLSVTCGQMILAFFGVYTLGMFLLFPVKDWLWELNRPWFWKYYFRHLPYGLLVFAVFLYREYKNAAMERLAERLNRRLDEADRSAASPCGEAPLRIEENGLPAAILPSCISHISVNGHYLDIHYLDGLEMRQACVRKPLTEILEELPEGAFLRVHRSHVVNPAHISSLTRDGRRYSVRLRHGRLSVPVSRGQVQPLLARLELTLPT